MSKGTKRGVPRKLSADINATKPYFTDLLKKIGQRFLGGEASLDIVQWICTDQKLPMNAIEALNAIVMGVDLVRGTNYIDQAMNQLSEGELGIRFTMAGLIPDAKPAENVTQFGSVSV